MLLRFFSDAPAHRCNLGSDVSVQLIDRLWTVENHAHVIEELGLRRVIGVQFCVRDLMERQVVDPRAEVDVLRVWLPDGLEAE